MTVALFMDHHVSAAITAGLRDRNVDVLTAMEEGAAQWPDEHILERAKEIDRVVFTQDDDFLVLADAWIEAERPFAGLVYAHQLAITTGQAVRDLELIAKALDPDDMRNRVEFIPY